MSKRDDQVSLKDMLSHACKAVELLGKTGRENLERDRTMQLALTRLPESRCTECCTPFEASSL